MLDIVMPLYNKGKFVGQAIEAVLAQTSSEWRMFVVDDGSTDDGPAIVESFHDPRIRLLRQANAGAAVARNRGIAAGSADWIALLDADDVWFPDHLAELESLYRRFPEAVLIGTAFEHWDGCSSPRETLAPGRRTAGLIRYFDRVARGRLPFFTSSVSVSRSAIGVVGPFKPVGAGVDTDTDLWARLALYGPVAASPKRTVLYRVATGGLTDQYVGNDVKDVDEMRLKDIALPVATVIQRLSNISDPRLRSDLHRYIDHEVGVALFQALGAGRQREAQKLSGLFMQRPRGKARAAVALARLPWPWGRRLLFAIFRIKAGARAAGRMFLR